MVVLIGSSTAGFTKEVVKYGYDKSAHEIYALVGNEKRTLSFEEDYTGNPSYSFDFFSGVPAIIMDSQSLHDSTVYATLNYDNNNFHIDCLYYNIKSKKNGVLTKEGKCGLNIPSPENYVDYIDQKVSDTENNMDSTDTSLLLKGKMSYLPIVVYKSKDTLLYKLYNNKQSMLDDKYSVISMDNNGNCDAYTNNPWLVFNIQTPQQVEIMSEKIVNGKIELTKATPTASDTNECILHPAIGVKSAKAYFYDDSYSAKKSYLIKNDKINLLSVSGDGKWCKARYISNKNSAHDNNMLCSDLSI
jgi:hypothetical protein